MSACAAHPVIPPPPLLITRSLPSCLRTLCGMLQVGPSLKRPEIPVWVVCSESHFTVLFAQDSRPLRDAVPFDLFFYDELANMEVRVAVRRCVRGCCGGLL